MPSASTRATLARHWELLALLPQRGPKKAASELHRELAIRGYTVSKRQIERDLHELSSVFPVECDASSVPYGWRWIPGSERSMPGLDVAEALWIAMAHQAAASLLPPATLELLLPRLQLAERKLAELETTNALASWRTKVHVAPLHLPLLAPKCDTDAVQVVHEALLAQEALDVVYSPLGSVQQTIRLQPLGLIQRGPVGYLLATAWDYQDPRLYALHRIVQASRTHESARVPQGCSLQNWLAEGGGQFGDSAAVKVQLRCNEDVLHILAETPLSLSQTIETDVVTAFIPNSWELHWWVMSQGAAVEVLNPPELRDAVANDLREAAARYPD